MGHFGERCSSRGEFSAPKTPQDACRKTSPCDTAGHAWKQGTLNTVEIEGITGTLKGNFHANKKGGRTEKPQRFPRHKNHTTLFLLIPS
jgi:hypothetical protein